jgi:hypothetical protein
MFWNEDNRDTVITVGAPVAFNLSGQVALGHVVSTGTRGTGPFRVRLAHKAAGHPAGHISRVRRSYSLLVLKQEQVPT